MAMAANLLPAQDMSAGGNDGIVNATDQTFTDITKQGYVLVDFWAEWCAPCRAIAPFVDEIAKEYKDKVKVAKLNIDENPLTTNTYGVMSIPLVVLFKDGQPVGSILGAQPKQKFVELIKSNVAE